MDSLPDHAWLEHFQRAAVRFSSGGSGSFVSSTGLVMTNHHVGADALQKLGTQDHDYMKNGFYAKTAAEEIKCADQELDVLVSIEDVTERVNAAVPAGADAAAAYQARRAAMNTIEKESFDKTGLRSDVVTLYQGGLYHLYRYKKYTDVRLVFAPEAGIAFFGGDPDNFEYPRYDLDICLFRVYENGQPVKNQDYLKLERGGGGRRRAGAGGRKPRQDRPPGYGGPPGISPRSAVPLADAEDLSPRGAAADVQRAERGKRPPRPGRVVHVRKRPQGPAGRAGRAPGPGGDGPQAGRRAGVSRSGGREPPASRASAARPGTRWRRRSACSQSAEGLRRPGAGRGLQHRSERPVPHRPRAGPHGGGDGQTQRRAAPRVPAVEPRFAQASAVLHGPALRRLPNREAGRFAELVRGNLRRGQRVGAARCSRASRRSSGRSSWSMARGWPTSNSARSSPPAECRPSQPPTTR